MKKLLLVALAAALLAGCPGTGPKQQKPPVSVNPDRPPVDVVPTPPVQPPPQLPPEPLNWMASIKPLVSNMLSSSPDANNGVILLDQVKNNTSGKVDTADATAVLKETLLATKRFSLVSDSKLLEGREAMELKGDDSLISRSKAIGLARYLGAKYIIYASANGSPGMPEIVIQLLQAQTGEILWSGKGNVQR
ncbi:penicillin-binding protein activator LpoB [Budvicia diplopodorum]|uniref:penicillin-binding protein activator LpoB n=1 Tax=Budvicia diplopodorum TaxID=1119056 RepID=UPI00135717BF|nr:penicillin-binding protein activator LpoB [Budvicia diplopodorum]